MAFADSWWTFVSVLNETIPVVSSYCLIKKSDDFYNVIISERHSFKSTEVDM